jgi:hypothetical protein
MQKGREQEVNHSNRKIKDFNEIGDVRAKLSGKKFAKQYVAHIVISVIIITGIILFSIIGLCS